MTQQIKFWKGDEITSMTGDNIFVYGANPEFRNGHGAALTARKFGAKPYGGGRGIVGNTYGLITKNLKAGFVEKATGIVYEKNGYRSISPQMISENIDELYLCATNNPNKKFFIAYKNDGLNLNGYTNKEVWDLFTRNKSIPSNVIFHNSFRALLSKGQSSMLTNQRHVTAINYDDAIKLDNQPRDNFTFFWHSPSPFSQWHPSLFNAVGELFTSAEQFMMYCKAKLFKDEDVAERIISLNSEEGCILAKFAGGEITREDILRDAQTRKEWDNQQKRIKRLGRDVRGYVDSVWIDKRTMYVTKGNVAKFNQNQDLKEKLLNTGNTIFAEANYFDMIWAIGIKESSPDATSPSKWKGTNLLGKILTDLRRDIR